MTPEQKEIFDHVKRLRKAVSEAMRLTEVFYPGFAENAKIIISESYCTFLDAPTHANLLAYSETVAMMGEEFRAIFLREQK